MNCREGDLAFIVKSYAGNEGKIVACKKLIDYYEFSLIGIMFNVWEINEPFYNNGYYVEFVADSCLKPIRDSDKQDEMLSIVSLKEKVKS